MPTRPRNMTHVTASGSAAALVLWLALERIPASQEITRQAIAESLRQVRKGGDCRGPSWLLGDGGHFLGERGGDRDHAHQMGEGGRCIWLVAEWDRAAP